MKPLWICMQLFTKFNSIIDEIRRMVSLLRNNEKTNIPLTNYLKDAKITRQRTHNLFFQKVGQNVLQTCDSDNELAQFNSTIAF